MIRRIVARSFAEKPRLYCSRTGSSYHFPVPAFEDLECGGSCPSDA
jgi:hypothetical protein